MYRYIEATAQFRYRVTLVSKEPFTIAPFASFVNFAQETIYSRETEREKKRRMRASISSREYIDTRERRRG